MTLAALKDNTLYEETGESNGSGDNFYAGRTGFRNNELLRRGLIAFDIAAAVPAGATIQSVELRLSMSKTVSEDQNVSLHRVLADWGEGASDVEGNEGSGTTAMPGDATWLHTFFDSDFWANPGGDFVSTASATQAVGNASEIYTWGSTAGMIDDVQSWLDNPAQNFGWLVRGNEDDPTSAKQFDSRSNPNQQNRPALIITYMSDTIFADQFED